MDKEITGKNIKDYIDEYYVESMITTLESQILGLLKARQENIPSAKNDREWLEFSDYVCKKKQRK